MTPDEAFDDYRRQPHRLPSHLRKFLIVIGGILSSLACAIGIMIFWFIF